MVTVTYGANYIGKCKLLDNYELFDKRVMKLHICLLCSHKTITDYVGVKKVAD